MAMMAMPVPRAILIDMDDTILSTYGRPGSPRTRSRPEFAAEHAPLPPDQVPAAILTFARNFWTNAEAAWRFKLGEARRLTVKGGFAAFAASGHRALPDDLATRLADRFTTFREEEMFLFPGAHEAIDRLRALGVKLAPLGLPTCSVSRSSVSSCLMLRPHPDRGRARGCGTIALRHGG
jgi:putative hydrolase of the HAD superfamily